LLEKGVVRDGGQRWLYANKAAKSRLLTQNTAFFVFNGIWAGIFSRYSLKRRSGFGIMGRELYWSVSGKLSKHAKIPFAEVNGKSEYS
jgi:hypothetical protein